MHRLILRAVLMALLAALVSACGTKPQQTVDPVHMFEIGAVAVTANGGVPAGIIRGVQRQLEQSIAATTSSYPKPRAVMNIHLAAIRRDRAGRGQAELSVTLSDVASGQPVLVRSYLVLAFAERGRLSDAALADAIAGRLRYEYALSTPAIRHVPRHDSTLSTRLGAGTDLEEKPATPLVVPLATAPTLGADQDPVLNSRTRIEPAVEPARIEPAVKSKKDIPVEQQPAQNELESGARAKVVIRPKAADSPPADDEPCVETLDTKC